MKKYQIEMLGVLQGFLDDYTVGDLFEELFPGQDPAEIFVEMYENGMIPNDRMESFLED